jgi:hypothetical protein
MSTRLWIEVSLKGKYLSATDALSLRNKIRNRIREDSIGEIDGGGCSLDGSSIDLEIITSDANAKVAISKILEENGLDEFSIRQVE